MQITETSNEGLKRTLQVVVPAGELGKRFTDRLDEIKDRVQLKGFRKGKVPVPHLKKMYGRSLMVEVLQDTVRETSNKALADRKERPAMQPSVSLPEDQAEIERVLAGQADLSYSMTFEVLPADRARRLQEPEARAARRRRRCRSRSTRRWASWSSAASRSRPRKAARRRPAIASPSTSSARSTAKPSKAAPPRARRSCSARATSSPASRKASPASRPARSATSPRPSRTTIRSPRWPARRRTSP